MSFNKQTDEWTAFTFIDGRRHPLGTFPNFDLALAALLEAEDAKEMF